MTRSGQRRVPQAGSPARFDTGARHNCGKTVKTP
nr:MAG TPA: hypothetical protein [Caudoviricetes sp.]